MSHLPQPSTRGFYAYLIGLATERRQPCRDAMALAINERLIFRDKGGNRVEGIGTDPSSGCVGSDLC